MRTHRILLLTTVLTGALLFYWGIGSIPLLSFNEARRAIPAANMLATGDWLLPRVNGELYLAKPPMLYWLSTATAHLAGAANEWAVRLPSAIAATAVALLAYRFARRQFGPWPALFTLQILIANSSFAMHARRAEIEMLLTAFCFCALLAALQFTRGDGSRRWLWLSYLLLGAAVLTKGPVALLFVTLPLLVDALFLRQSRQWQALRDPVGWLLFIMVAATWFLAVMWQTETGIWQATVEKDIVGKVSRGSGSPFFMYAVWLIADFFPFSLLLFAAPVTTWRRWRNDSRHVALLLAFGAILVVFSAFSAKHAKYFLPAYPLMAIILGQRLAEFVEATKPALRKPLLAAALLLPAGYAAFYTTIEARVYEYRYAAFPQFRDWLGGVGTTPLYGYVKIDERLIYYAGRDIAIVDRTSLEARRIASPSFLLLAEGKWADESRPAADCTVREFSPYLSRHKKLSVFGFGVVCQNLSGGDTHRVD
jgi:4-amino-4-deoxy-L-arabinose transferase-like glycosyltransferase